MNLIASTVFGIAKGKIMTEANKIITQEKKVAKDSIQNGINKGKEVALNYLQEGINKEKMNLNSEIEKSKNLSGGRRRCKKSFKQCKIKKNFYQRTRKNKMKSYRSLKLNKRKVN
jgi:hypothetical protein